ncbi:hypothetical protein EZJ55_12910 [Microcystis aeruginosa EAWAG127a]|uniref:Uncharacterized protein n=1 Tax=Microcystis aeruginosa EAWAG127a TaxID=2529855 RepID=A0A5J5LV15_MICAE|nr:hypothetical protein EZJ55_12910 [Microcystis aeruginosa EAWAG127a]
MGFNSDSPSDQHPPYQGGKGGSVPLSRGEGGISTLIKGGRGDQYPYQGGKGGSVPPLSRGEGGISTLIKGGINKN